MSAFLFLQRFENGLPVAIPFADAVAILGRYGKSGRGRGDTEITFESDTTAIGCTVVGNPQSGALCIGFERPRYDSGLRNVVWECMQALHCTAFNDTLDSIYVLPGEAAALPGTWGPRSPGIARQITTAQQLWPDELEIAVDATAMPAARYPNPNPNGLHFQMFDGTEGDAGLLIEIRMRSEACNPGTLRVLRNLELRVAAAIQTNPEYGACYRFAHMETSTLFLESPRLMDHGTRATIITPPPNDSAAAATGFIADRGLFDLASRAASSCVELARQDYRVELDGSLESIEALSNVLDAVRERDRQERRAQPPAAGSISKAATRWVYLAGPYIGSIVQRHIGAQWGYMRRPASRRQPALCMHNGRIRHPHLQVLDHIINGRSDDVAVWVRALAKADRSATPRDEDMVGNIPQFCDILLGKARFNDRGLALEEQIPRAALDFSVDSLRELDRFLTQAAAVAATLPSQAVGDLALLAGAYLGEVIRGNAGDRALWNWVNYDDYTQAHPEFRKQRPREFGFLAFLDSAENTTYPLAHVEALLAKAPLPPTYVLATQLLGSGTAAPKPAAAATAPANGARAGNGGPAGNGAATGNMPSGGASSVHTSPGDAAAADDNEMKQALANVREALSKWRRIATQTDVIGIRAAGPDWVRGHALSENVAQQALLLQKGEVVWGALLQANNALFKKGPDDLPGAVIYSTDRYFDARPHELAGIATRLFAHKGVQAPEAIRPISEWLADEKRAAFNLPVPAELTSRSAFATGTLFFRKHLPLQLVGGGWMPMLVHPETRAVMVVPRQFWNRELVARWQAREPGR
jgi:hypothetical protein